MPTQTAKPNKPVHEISDGALRVSIWKNEGDKGPWYSVTCRRRYKDKSADEWKDTYSYGQDDILPLSQASRPGPHLDTWPRNSSSGRRRPPDRPRRMPPRPRDRQPRLTAEQIPAQLEPVDAQAKEVLGHIYRAMLKTPEFTLENGTKCRVDAFYEPEVNAGRGAQMRDRRSASGRSPGIHGRPYRLGKILRQGRGTEGATQTTWKAALKQT